MKSHNGPLLYLAPWIVAALGVPALPAGLRLPIAAIVAPVVSLQKDIAPAPSGSWTSISDDVLKQLPDDGKRQTFERGTAGVSIDRTTGDIRMIVNNGGVWKSSDRGAT